MHIRVGNSSDIPALCNLASQLGYVVSRTEMARRLEPYARRDDHCLFVAVDGKRVVGMLNGSVHLDLCYEPQVELQALVVDEASRGTGVGKALLAELETWARTREILTIKLGSRETRKDAHRFYLREGFELEKIHHILRKQL
jgi:GNAT superfamily N-acetyltransferase